eukprot:TRINITY_DN8588_c0_g1_i1.p1 TRINITY_DN8588_c0_g1~~TRINITY_DN8588_c0_g1_i1.p1  ORF type:complete len:443 (-),score=75.12 TRINITY_DN8588_c0_g1_i1:99-1427(-)
MAQTKPHTFPILPDDQIISTMTSFGVALALEELQKPIPEVVREVFEQIVQRILMISTADLKQPQFDALGVLMLPELHDESIGEFMFWKSLLKLMNTVGVEDFGTRDIHRPEYKRFKKHLSGLINFVMFRDDRIVRYEELTTITDQLADQKQNLESELEARQMELRSLKVQYERDLPVIQSLQAEIETTESEIKQLNKRQVEMQYETREIKYQVTSLAELRDEVKFKVVNTRSECSKLQGSVVSSPEKVKKLLEDMEISLETEKEFIIDAQARSSSLQARYETLCKIERDVQKCIFMMDECDQEMQKYKRASKALKETKAAMQEKETQLKDITNTEQYSQKGLQTLQEKAQKQAKAYEQKKSSLQQQLMEAKNERLQAEKQHSIIKGKLENYSQHQAAIQQGLEMLRKEHEKEINALGRKYDTLATTVQQYHKKLFLSMHPKK